MSTLSPGHESAVANRRQFNGLLAACSVGWLTGCAGTPPSGSQAGAPPAEATSAAWLKPIVLRSTGPRHPRIDAHAHFFNASDVPVRGFLQGPVANEVGGSVGRLLKLLAPLGQQLARIAPSAREELDSLRLLQSHPSLRSVVAREVMLDNLVAAERARISRSFYESVRNTPFNDEYNKIVRARQSARSPGFSEFEANDELNVQSVVAAMQLGKQPKALTPQLRAELSKQPYPEGVLAFIGCMLSARWMNLRQYSQAFSSAPGAFGIDHAFGALVDFDLWLEPTSRSNPKDQIALHQLLCEISGGYMRPLVAYNPWRDAIEDGETARRAVEAVDKRGFIGIKLYPPNGFRPYGNTARSGASRAGSPDGKTLDKYLSRFWDLCIEKHIPVMAHAGSSMGDDSRHNAMAGPEGWAALLQRMTNREPPVVNLGHFGGDIATDGWTEEFAKLMGRPEGAGLYGDIAYWNQLTCTGSNDRACQLAQKKLRTVLAWPQVAKRVMYGSDWHMLAREREWWQYPFDIAAETSEMPISQDDLFGANAARCFASTFGRAA